VQQEGLALLTRPAILCGLYPERCLIGVTTARVVGRGDQSLLTRGRKGGGREGGGSGYFT
jgi:hypothetical protein